MNIWQNFRTRFFRKRILVFCFLNAESHPGRLYRDTRNTLVNLSQCSQSRPRNNCYRGVFNAFRESRNAIIYRTPVKTDEICRAESPGELARARCFPQPTTNAKLTHATGKISRSRRACFAVHGLRKPS